MFDELLDNDLYIQEREKRAAERAAKRAAEHEAIRELQ